MASGDALPDAVVLWTRLAPDPLANGGTAGMPGEDVPVVWEVAHQRGLRHDGRLRCRHRLARPRPRRPRRRDRADAGHDLLVPLPRRAVHEHRPGAPSRCRRPTGRRPPWSSATRAASTTRPGFYAAHRDIAEAQLDALVFLGDYIYEGRAHPVGQDEAIRSHNGAEPTDLAGYRDRYALYRTDADLQASHASTGWYVIWDDHEVENNYAGDHSPDPAISEADFHARRAAAYQAWWEHQPVRLPPPTSADYQIYRSFALGPLGQLFLLDGRQYRSDQACGDRVLSLEPACPETFAPGRTMLGDAQERWLLDGLAATTATWNVIGNQTILSDLTLNGAVLNFDQWDGYPDARQRLLGGIDQANLTNVVTITGDIHAAGVADLTVDDENGRHAGRRRAHHLVGLVDEQPPHRGRGRAGPVPERPLRRRHQARLGAQHPDRVELGGRVPRRRRHHACRLAHLRPRPLPDRPDDPRRPAHRLSLRARRRACAQSGRSRVGCSL